MLGGPDSGECTPIRTGNIAVATDDRKQIERISKKLACGNYPLVVMAHPFGLQNFFLKALLSLKNAIYGLPAPSGERARSRILAAYSGA